MEETTVKVRRLAKNTILLYARMFLIMIVGLYTSRIILKNLGIVDYGVYNVIGGTVMMFSLLTTSLSTAISRYITFTLGTKNVQRLEVVFSTSFVIQLFMALVVVVIAEVVGQWFLETTLNIPFERMESAHWVLHCSILIFALNLLVVPFNALIIAHEKMSAFAYISIAEVLMKLIVAFSLTITFYDKLIVYSLLLLGISVLLLFVYAVYCRLTFIEAKLTVLLFDKVLIKEMAGFAGWNLLGTGATLFNTQGVNIATNLVFGVTVNAARGIADQIHSVIQQFINSFTTAFNPQITKSYAEHDYDYLFSLIIKGAKYSYYLALLFFVPFLFETEAILHLWLGDYPDYAPVFIRLSLISNMIDFLGNQTARTVWATGNVKRYYIVTCSVSLFVFPISYLLFKIGFEPYWSYIVFSVLYAILVPLRLIVLHHLIDEFNPFIFYKNVILVILPVTICSLVLPGFIYLLLSSTINRTILIIVVSLMWTPTSVLILGMNQSERIFLKDNIKTILVKIKK